MKLAKFSAKLVANFRRSLEGDFRASFCWGKSPEAFSTKTPPQISPSNFTTRFWVVAGPKKRNSSPKLEKCCGFGGRNVPHAWPRQTTGKKARGGQGLSYMPRHLGLEGCSPMAGPALRAELLAARSLVAQCSATPATVAATPPCSATPFQTQISVRLGPAKNHPWIGVPQMGV